VELTILEHFLKDNNREAALSLHVEHELKEIFEVGLSIYEQVKRGEYAAAIQWAES
jgi:hypothetical protein